jgi:PhnB protein
MYVPPGFAIVTPYILVSDVAHYIVFLERALGGKEIGRSVRPDGRVANAQIAFGSTTIMVGEAQQAFPATHADFYFYVENADTAIEQALNNGATLAMEVADMPYGDRQGGVRDPAGNTWWISQRLIREPYF